MAYKAYRFNVPNTNLTFEAEPHTLRIVGGKAIDVNDANLCYALQEMLSLAERVAELEANVERRMSNERLHMNHIAKLEAGLLDSGQRYQRQIQDLGELVDSRGARIAELEEETKDLRFVLRQIFALNQEMTGTEAARIWSRIETLRADLEAAIGLRDVAAGERDELAARVTELETENRRYLEQIAEQGARIGTLEAENLRLEGELHASKAYAAVMAEEDKKLCLEVDRLRYAEGRLTSLRLEVDKRDERIAHLETIIRGHETNTRLFKARIDALIAEVRAHRTDLAAAIKTGEEPAERITFLEEERRLDKHDNAAWAALCAAKESRLSRLDALLSSDEPPEGLIAAILKGAVRTEGASNVWRWFREQFAAAEQPSEK